MHSPIVLPALPSGKLVLLAANDDAVRDGFTFALQRAGLCVHAFGQSDALLADPALHSAVCLVVDDRRPMVDGLALLARVRRAAGPPVILLTDTPGGLITARAYRAGARSVLELPLLDNTLIDCVLAVAATDLREHT